MEKEKKVTVMNETATRVNEAATEVNEVEVKTKVKLVLERSQFAGNDGRQYYSYMLRGKVRGRDVKVDFAPKDKGGYEVLDIVFDVGPVELLIAEATMTDSDGRKTKYMTYKAVSYDEDGNPYECGVKPSRDSDKALLKMLLMSIEGAK